MWSLGAGSWRRCTPWGRSASGSKISHVSRGPHPLVGRSLLFSYVSLRGRLTKTSRESPRQAHFRKSHSWVWAIHSSSPSQLCSYLSLWVFFAPLALLTNVATALFGTFSILLPLVGLVS